MLSLLDCTPTGQFHLEGVTLPFYIVGICDVFFNSTYQKTVNDSSPDLARCESRVCLMVLKRKRNCVRCYRIMSVSKFLSSEN